MRKFVVLLGAVILWLLPFVDYAHAYYRSPLDFDDDKYVTFGNSEVPWNEPNGIPFLIIDHSSTSHSWVNLTVIVDSTIIGSRKIGLFYVLANGKIVDSFRPQYGETPEGNYDYKSYYVVKPDLDNLIGTKSYFQVIAVEEAGDNTQYIVGWSKPTEEIQLDPLPVRDAEAISVLYAILERLNQVLAKLNEMLEAIKDQTRVSPQVKERFDNAVTSIWEKSPMLEAAKELEKNSEALKEMQSRLASPGSELKFGGMVDLLPTAPGGEVVFLDLTPYREEVVSFRVIMAATTWLFFLHMLAKWITPKLDI